MSNQLEECLSVCCGFFCGICYTGAQQAGDTYRPGGGGVCTRMRCCKDSFDHDSFDEHPEDGEAPPVVTQPSSAPHMNDTGPKEAKPA
ncbi:hypothetical protein FA95DRAFT_1313320 [Auriscalpium vulgare]|uniref:Uncharacterized protein n=1 Tax=Auriscalpium vulgare TaxID=40419 RepID=A0ACB8R1P3_9AGAM|nr:hypothetical protein FA95DRAFT_1313320 [Auriscalpium vulgare]